MSEYREAMNIAETARLIHMSRSRFNQLLGTVFPLPKRDEHGRPYFDREQQMQIVEIRRTNKGMDGKPMLFRATGSRTSMPAKPKGKTLLEDDGGRTSSHACIARRAGSGSGTNLCFPPLPKRKVAEPDRSPRTRSESSY